MKLILSDKPLLCKAELESPDTTFIDLSALKIAQCIGCFGCWTKTPGKCVIRDDAVTVYPRIAAADRVMYISRICFGGYDTVMKTMLERAIPVQQAFIRLLHGETHHVQRSVVPKQAVIIGYGDISGEEKEIFRQLVARNAKNMNFETFRVCFAAENALEQAVYNEVAQWKTL